MARPRALDLFCCGGGASDGLHQAGFDVTGVDVEQYPNYPYNFIKSDVRKIDKAFVMSFDFVWASPPCQKYTVSSKVRDDYNPENYDELITPTRELLSGHPFTCIENVEGAPIRKDLVLVGGMFGLDRIIRKRVFELSFFVFSPPMVEKNKKIWDAGLGVTVTQSLSSPNHFYKRKEIGLPGRVPPKEACEAMGIDRRLTAREVGESIPPAYSKYISSFAMRSIKELA
jgi:DNA (cytosine-5)-methyltransferase 1